MSYNRDYMLKEIKEKLEERKVTGKLKKEVKALERRVFCPNVPLREQMKAVKQYGELQRR